MMRKLCHVAAGSAARKYLLVAVLVGLGLIVVLSDRDPALDNDPAEVADAIDALNQGYRFATVNGSNTTPALP